MWVKLLSVSALFLVLDIVHIADTAFVVRAQKVRPSTVVSVSADQFESLLAEGGKVVLDVRLKGECGAFSLIAHLGNIHITKATTLGTAVSEDEAVLAAEELVAFVKAHPVLKTMRHKRRPLVVVCCQGIRSQAASQVLFAEGFEVYNLTTGMLDSGVPNHLFFGKRPKPPTPEKS